MSKNHVTQRVMEFADNDERLLGKQVWCIVCVKKKPPIIRPADYLIPVRESHYGAGPDGFIDRRLMGICKECLKSKNEFQKSNTQAVDVNNDNLITSLKTKRLKDG